MYDNRPDLAGTFAAKYYPFESEGSLLPGLRAHTGGMCRCNARVGSLGRVWTKQQISVTVHAVHCYSCIQRTTNFYYSNLVRPL